MTIKGSLKRIAALRAEVRVSLDPFSSTGTRLKLAPRGESNSASSTVFTVYQPCLNFNTLGPPKHPDGRLLFRGLKPKSSSSFHQMTTTFEGISILITIFPLYK